MARHTATRANAFNPTLRAEIRAWEEVLRDGVDPEALVERPTEGWDPVVFGGGSRQGAMFVHGKPYTGPERRSSRRVPDLGLRGLGVPLPSSGRSGGVESDEG
jgi:hypothetical protein